MIKEALWMGKDGWDGWLYIGSLRAPSVQTISWKATNRHYHSEEKVKNESYHKTVQNMYKFGYHKSTSNNQ